MPNTRNATGPHGRSVTVSADDGVPLRVREFGRADAPLTAVFLHGHCLHTDSWSYLREYLSQRWGSDVRMVFYDHRGHGRSGAAPAETYTIDQLGRDLDAVIRTVVPDGPVILIGHSMGGMTALAYARQNPHVIGSRIVGVGLISTAASGITRAGLARHLHNPAVALFQRAVHRAPGMMQGTMQLGRRLCAPVIWAVVHSSRRVSPLATVVINETSVVTMSSFLNSFVLFDETPSLAVLSRIPSLVLCGSVDLLTPFEHSVAIASQLPASELVRIDGAGHSVILDQAADVAHAIASLVDRAVGAVQTGTTGLSAAC